MSIWRGCSPWHLPQLLFQTSSQDSPCPEFNYYHLVFPPSRLSKLAVNFKSVGNLSQSDTIESSGKPSGPSLGFIFVGLSATIPSLRDCRNIIQQRIKTF